MSARKRCRKLKYRTCTGTTISSFGKLICIFWAKGILGTFTFTVSLVYVARTNNARDIFNHIESTPHRLKRFKPQVAQAHYERSAYISLFHFAYIMTSAKYKSLYEKYSKYALIAINAK